MEEDIEPDGSSTDGEPVQVESLPRTVPAKRKAADDNIRSGSSINRRKTSIAPTLASHPLPVISSSLRESVESFAYNLRQARHYIDQLEEEFDILRRSIV